MKTLLRRSFVATLFAALVLLLLWFQGIVGHGPPLAARAPEAPRLATDDRTALVERLALPRVQVHPGFVEAVDPAAVAPRVMATIAAVAVREGDVAEAGQELVVLDDRDARARHAQAGAARDAAEAAALRARLDFERAERLLAAEALTPREWEAARAARDGAEAALQRAGEAVDEAAVALSWYRLTAPFAGRVLERLAEPGQLALPGQPVLTLYRAESLRFRVALPEERAGELAVGAELPLTFDRLGERTARVTRVLPPADPRTGTVELHLALAPDAALRPGLLGRLSLVVGEYQALVVPAAAVRRIGQVERAELVREGRVTPVTVRTGKVHGERVEILSGLAEGERVRLP